MAGSVSSALFLLERLYSELTKTSTALSLFAVLSVLSAARRLVLIFVNSLYLFFHTRRANEV